jgi:2-C-methyl-D-erythritol 4-phosphate cytidylyltransferase
MKDSLYAIIVAGGSGSRMGAAIPKQFLRVAGRTILELTLQKFHQAIPEISIVVVLPEAEIPRWEYICRQEFICVPHVVVSGGQTRFHSVKNGLDTISDPQGIVAIHDGVRPFVSARAIAESFKQAAIFGNATLSVPLKDSIRRKMGESTIAEPRTDFLLVQTPQTFQIPLIQAAFATDYQPFFTDDASVAEYAGQQIHLIEGNDENIKITTPQDLIIAEALYAKNPFGEK